MAQVDQDKFVLEISLHGFWWMATQGSWASAAMVVA